MLDPSQVAGVLVTRGDVPFAETMRTWPREFEQVVWNNAVRDDLAVYGRYAAIEETARPVIFVQDDDVILPPESIAALLAAYVPGKVVCNMPERFRHDFYRDHALVGFGAVFDRDLPERAFDSVPSVAAIEWIRLFHHTCDVVFTALTDRLLVDVPYEELPYAHADNRMWRQPNHIGDRARMLELARSVRDWQSR